MSHWRASFLRPFLLLSLLLTLPGCMAPKPDYTAKPVNMDFVFVKGGTYQMGSLNYSREQPVHQVTIGDLYVAMYEVTFKQYDQFCLSVPSCEPPSDAGWGRGSRPVINVSWHDANAYAEWLSNETGLKFRLPTEAEWEYFARAGTTSPFWTGRKIPKGRANCQDCGSQWDNVRPAPVGSFPPNPWGIYDTIGNVIEWVADDYTEGYRNAPNDGSPMVIDGNERKAQRGGAWDYPAKDSRSAARDYRKSNIRTKDAGFRLVMVPQGSSTNQ